MKKYFKLGAFIIAFVMIFSFVAACGGEEDTPPPPGPTVKTYTYTDYMVTSPTSWNPHSWESNDDSIIYQYITDTLLEFSFNDDKNGYVITPSMASELPTDISQTYKGTYGVPGAAKAGDGYAWRFKLNQNAKWENGTAINADTYVYSLQQMLNNQMLNRRSDTYVGGEGAIFGGKNYLYSERSGYNPMLNNEFGYSAEALEVGAEFYFSWDVELPAAIADLFDLYGASVTTWRDITRIEDLTDPDKPWYGIDEFELEDGTNVYTKWQNIIEESGTSKGLKMLEVTDINYDEVNGDSPNYEVVDEELFEELEADLDALMTMWFVDWKYEKNIKDYIGSKYDQWLYYMAIAAGYSEAYGDAYEGWVHEFFLGRPFTYDKYEWKDVGFKKIDNYTIDVVFVNPITELFYLAYTFGASRFLVYEPLYEANKVLPVAEGGLITSKYCTSAATTISYGPYKLASYQLDKEIHMNQNANWFGYSDAQFEGQYQTTDIKIEIGLTQPSALQKFLQGKLSVIDLENDDMANYGSSSYLQVLPRTYTNKMTINSDRASLIAAQEAAGANINKVMLSYLEFRQALSFSLDRAEYARQLGPSSQPGYGLINYMYVSDYQTGALYRDEVLAKLASVAVYYTEIAAGYKTLTSPYNPNNFIANYDVTVPGQDYTYGEYVEYLYEGMTGRNIEKARELFVTAFTAAIAAGDFSMSQNVVLDYVSGGTSPSANFQAHAALVQKYINEALAGTAYAGKVTLNVKGSPSQADYWDNIRAGKTDIGVNAWGGDPFGPFTIINDCYLNDGQRHEYGMNKDLTQSMMITLKIDGEEKTYSFWQWGGSLSGDATQSGVTINYSNADYETKVLIASTLEFYWLSQYCSVPVNYDAVTNLVSKQINFATKTYIQLLEFGGIRYMTYNYTDAEWSTYISNSNNLNYKS